MTLLHILLSCYLLLLDKDLVMCNQQFLSWFDAQETCRSRNETLLEGVPGIANQTENIWIGKYKRLSLWIKIVGCYKENSVKASSDREHVYQMQIGSAGFCQEICLSSNMTVFAIEGKECRCLKQLPKEKGDCDAACYKWIDRAEKPYFDECGGNKTYSVFLSGTNNERDVGANVKGSPCVAIYCSEHSNSTFYFKEDCTVPYKPACIRNTRVTGSWMESMQICRSNFSSTNINEKIYLNDIEKTCNTTGRGLTDISWLGVAKESYYGLDRGTFIEEEDKSLFIQCILCTNHDCNFKSCERQFNGTVHCTKKNQENNEETKLTKDKSNIASQITSINGHTITTTAVTIAERAVSEVPIAQITSKNNSTTIEVTYSDTNKQSPITLTKSRRKETAPQVTRITSTTGTKSTEGASTTLSDESEATETKTVSIHITESPEKTTTSTHDLATTPATTIIQATKELTPTTARRRNETNSTTGKSTTEEIRMTSKSTIEANTTVNLATAITARSTTTDKTIAAESTAEATASTAKLTKETKSTAAISTTETNTTTDKLATKEETTAKSVTETKAILAEATTITSAKNYENDLTEKDYLFEIGVPIVTVGGVISAVLLIYLCRKIKRNKKADQEQRDVGYFEFDSKTTGIINHNYFLLEPQEQIIKSENHSKEIESPNYDIDGRKSDHPRDREVKLMDNNKEHPCATVNKNISISENPSLKNKGGVNDRLGGMDSDQGHSDSKRTSINNHDYLILEPQGQSSKSENANKETESPYYDIDGEKYDHSRTREKRAKDFNMSITNTENSYATVNKSISNSNYPLMENKGVNGRVGGMDSDPQNDSKRTSIENHTYFILEPQGESNKSENKSKKNESPISDTKEGVYDHLRDRELNTGNADTENTYDTVSKGISISEYQSLENEEETYDRLGDKKFTNEDDVDDTYHHAVTFRSENRDYDTIDRFKSHGSDRTYYHMSQ